MEDYYEYLDSNGVTTLYKLIKDDTVALIDSYSVTINGITTNLDNHVNNSDIHTPISDIENMVDTKISGLVNSAPETLDTLKELSDALGNDPNFATTVANQIGNKASKDDVYTKQETDTLLDGKANSVHNHVVSDITDFPTIPTKTSQLINDSGFITSSSGLITSVSWSDIKDKPNFSTVATSGSYTDLSNTPTIPTKVSQLENDTGFVSGLTDVVDTKSNQTINGTKTFTDIAISNKELHYKDTKYDWTDKSLNTWNDAGHVAWFDKTGNRRMHELVGANGGVWRKVCYINETQYFSVDSNKNISYEGISFKFNSKDVAIDENVVHTSGNETIAGFKSFTEVLDRRNDVTTSTVATATQLVDTNANRCGWIANRMHWAWNYHVHNRHIAFNENSGKEVYIDIISSNNGSGGLFVGGTATNINLNDVTSATGHTALATMGWVNNPETSTNVVHRTGNEAISGVKSFNDMIKVTNGTVQVGADTGYSVTFNYSGSIVSKQASGTYNIALPKFDGELLGTTFVKGTNSWYRKHSDGFIEQGGRISGLSLNQQTITVTFPIAFSDNQYTVNVTTIAADHEYTVNRIATVSKTLRTTSMTIVNNGWHNTYVGITVSWYACGY